MRMLPWILAAWMFVLTVLLALGGWWMLFHVKQSIAQLRVMLASIGRPVHEKFTTEYSHVGEGKPIKGAAGIEFYQGFHSSPYWKPLAQKAQSDTRELLARAHLAVLDGKADAATFLSGAAFYASQQAVMVERELVRLPSLLESEAQNAALDKLLEDQSPRPARY